MKKVSNKKEEKRDQYTVVLENLRSDFKVVGEGVQFLQEKVTKIEDRLGKVEDSLDILKGEAALIRHNQVTRDEFKMLETRVLNLEKKFSHK